MNYCFYFLAGVLFISGVSVLASTTDDNSIFVILVNFSNVYFTHRFFSFKYPNEFPK